MRDAESELTRLKYQLELADVKLNAERARAESLELRAALRERELELRELELRAGAPVTTVSASEDDTRAGLESPSSSPVANAAVCTTCQRMHGTVARGARGLETIAMEDGYKTCVSCRERRREYHEKKKTSLVNTAPHAVCGMCKRRHGDVVNTREHGPMKTVLDGGYKRCERCRLGVDRAAAAAKKRNRSGVDATVAPGSSVNTAPHAVCCMCKKRHGDVVNTHKRGLMKTVLDGGYKQCERCRLGVDRAYARAVRRAGNVKSSPGSEGKRQCRKCKRHAGPNLTNNGVLVDVCFAAPHDSTCIACKELERDTNSARPNARSTGSPVATTSGRMQTMMVRPAARKNASNAASPMLSPAPSRKRKMYEEELRDAHVVMHSAADKGDIARCDELRQIFIDDKDKFDNAYAWHHELISCVARDGRRPIEVIEWAMSHGAKLTKAAAKRAVERTRHKNREYQGRYTSALDLVKFIHSRSPKLIDDETMFCACEFGEMECLRWIIENVDGCKVCTWPNGRTPRGTPNELMLIAAQNGHVDILKYLYDNNCDWTADDAKEAIGFVMNAQPSAPLNWHEVVKFIQSTAEWRAENQPPRVF